MNLTTDKPLSDGRVERWVYSGQLPSAVERVGVSLTDVLQAAGCVLDRAGATDALGDVLFQAMDGQWYVLTVEAVLSPATSDWVRDSLAAADAEEVSDDQDG